MYTLSYYIAEKFSTLKRCWHFICLVTLLSCFPSYIYAEAYFVLLRCWDVPIHEALPTYTLSYYMAEIYPILVRCRFMVYLKTLMSVFLKRCWQSTTIEYYVTQKPRKLSTRVNVSNVSRLEAFQQCNKTG